MKFYLMLGSIPVAFILIFYLCQRNLIYFPDKTIPLPEQFNAADLAIISLSTKDNLVLSSWYKARKQNQATILFLHGNAGHVGYRIPLARQLINAGFGILLLEYRGYGGNPGKPTEDGLYEDARSALQFLFNQGVQKQDIVIYGESLGTAVATKLASQTATCALILQSPFTSLTSLARYHYPWIFIKPWDKFNSLKRMKQIHTPLLLIHGKLDEVVPIAEGRKIFTNANEPKVLLEYSEKHHNDLWNEDFFKQIIDFINKHCNGQ